MLVKRIVAFLIDWVILFVISGILGAILGQDNSGITGIFSILLVIGYQAVFLTAMNGQTPGKMVMGIRVVSASGGPITPVQAVLRGVGYVINSAICFIGWLLVVLGIFDIHNTIAGTTVVE